MLKFETDSRLIQKGQTFVAIKGHTVDGHEYIENAIKNGATDVIAEHDVKCKVPVTIVKDSELYLKEELKKLYSDKLNKRNSSSGYTSSTTKYSLAILIKNFCFSSAPILWQNWGEVF